MSKQHNQQHNQLAQYTKVYSDGGFCWKSNLTQKIKSGIIAYKIGDGKVIVKKVYANEIKGLQQYSNLMEFFASIIALEQAKELVKYPKIILYTDSQVNKAWLTNKNKLKKLSSKHAELKRRALKIINQLEHFVVIQIPREKNLAGEALEIKYKL